eukprot:TRINITY_DN2393_c0_g1_i1.p1 TRINITY_DN2393_c0_g1~~TRINITY_DN2393_c0_g1_i1.p1  ORF type:complete len:524 (+),score=145.69 TRINITY_DN2393_c0_g1_i1:57-1628(+)
MNTSMKWGWIFLLLAIICVVGEDLRPPRRPSVYETRYKKKDVPSPPNPPPKPEDHPKEETITQQHHQLEEDLHLQEQTHQPLQDSPESSDQHPQDHLYDGTQSAKDSVQIILGGVIAALVFVGIWYKAKPGVGVEQTQKEDADVNDLSSQSREDEDVVDGVASDGIEDVPVLDPARNASVDDSKEETEMGEMASSNDNNTDVTSKSSDISKEESKEESDSSDEFILVPSSPSRDLAIRQRLSTSPRSSDAPLQPSSPSRHLTIPQPRSTSPRTYIDQEISRSLSQLNVTEKAKILTKLREQEQKERHHEERQRHSQEKLQLEKKKHEEKIQEKLRNEDYDAFKHVAKISIVISIGIWVMGMYYIQSGMFGELAYQWKHLIGSNGWRFFSFYIEKVLKQIQSVFLVLVVIVLILVAFWQPMAAICVLLILLYSYWDSLVNLMAVDLVIILTQYLAFQWLIEKFSTRSQSRSLAKLGLCALCIFVVINCTLFELTYLDPKNSKDHVFDWSWFSSSLIKYKNFVKR